MRKAILVMAHDDWAFRKHFARLSARHHVIHVTTLEQAALLLNTDKDSDVQLISIGGAIEMSTATATRELPKLLGRLGELRAEREFDKISATARCKK